MKMQELRQMSDQQLHDVLQDCFKAIFHLKFQAATQKLDSPSAMRKQRKDVARIKTLQRERELNKARG